VDVSTVRWWVMHFSSSDGNGVISTGADCFECGMWGLVHHWGKCIANGGECIEKQHFVAENLLPHIVLLCSLYLL